MKLIVGVESNIVSLVVLFVYQMFFSFASISFICHGITYLDDELSSTDSPGYIGRLCGKYSN